MNKYIYFISKHEIGHLLISILNEFLQAKTTPNSIHTNYPESRSDSTGQSTAKKEFVTRYEVKGINPHLDRTKL